MSGTRFTIEVQPKIPATLSRLEELAGNLLYSWDRQVRGLFFRLDRQLWDETGHNPKVFLRRIDQHKLEQAAEDPIYMQDYVRVISSFDSYLNSKMKKPAAGMIDDQADIISYSCAEFGLHESLPIYSGGLGILAGDHCKAASDLGLPFVAFGMLYRQGYFTQQIDSRGKQIAEYLPSHFPDLPVKPATDRDGKQIEVAIDVPGRTIYLQLWVANVGHISLYLLDSDLEKNTDSDRRITYQLYGGDLTNRLLQEVVLGIGGVRAHRALGLNPAVWHINEGHAAFQILERCRELVAQGEDFYTALEAVASCTVFTTHTPVPAGHDIFDRSLFSHYFASFAESLKIPLEKLFELGRSPGAENAFNMTALALRGSRFHNGVSKIHGSVSSVMERYVWPQIAPEENPLRYVTNGVHVPTFLSNEWASTFDMQFGGGWRNELLNEKYWRQIHDIPNHSFWSVRQLLKAKMLEAVYERSVTQHRRNGFSESQIRRLTRFINPQKTDVLTIGFARRFATYKRATLIFSDPQRLKKLLDGQVRPVVFIFAGKAHPHDHPGQELIRRIHEYSHDPEFEGKIILLENYDIALARKLVTGVDVWLNNPAYPLEASGTSGQKASINGVLNLSILDGWWGEGFDGQNGWAITPHDEKFSPEFRDLEESNEILDTLENEIIPLYYQRDGQGYSTPWIEKCKRCMETLIPRFNAQRMVRDYLMDFYLPAIKQGKRFYADTLAPARNLATWKKRIREAWPMVHIERIDEPSTSLYAGQVFEVKVAVSLVNLSAEDVLVDCLIGQDTPLGAFERHTRESFRFVEMMSDGRALFAFSTELVTPGLQSYMVRMYPHHEMLSQRFEVGCMLWL